MVGLTTVMTIVCDRMTTRAGLGAGVVSQTERERERERERTIAFLALHDRLPADVTRWQTMKTTKWRERSGEIAEIDATRSSDTAAAAESMAECLTRLSRLPAGPATVSPSRVSRMVMSQCNRLSTQLVPFF